MISRSCPTTPALTIGGSGCCWGPGGLRRVVASYVGENKEFARQYLAGELEVELTPQGTLAERMRAGGSGIAAFYTATGVGTMVADGGMPWRYDADGTFGSPRRPNRRRSSTASTTCWSARSSPTSGWSARGGDRHGNLVFREAARNFNPLAAMCGRVTIAEVEQLVEPGELDPDEIHTPGAYVHHVLALTPEQAADKRIERVNRPRGGSPDGAGPANRWPPAPPSS